MVKLRKYMAKGLLALAAAVLLAGCSGGTSGETVSGGTDESGETVTDEGENTATEEDTDADSTYDDAALKQYEKDDTRIRLLNPVKPDDMGEVNNLVYKGLSFEAPVAEEVTMDDVDNYLAESLLPYVQVPIEGAVVEDGDTVNIDYVGTRDGVAFDGGTAEGYDLVIGSGTFIEGFEEGLIGAKTGETVSLNLTFPEDYWNEDMAGAEVVFDVTVNSVSREITVDEFSDAAAQTIMADETATAESCREYLYEYLQKLATVNAKSSLYNNALAAALAESDIVPSEEAEEWELDITIESYNSNLELQGLSLAYYLYYSGYTYDDFRDELKEQAGEAAKEVVLRYAICEAEGIEYNDESKALYLEEFDYTQEELDEVAGETDQEQAVIWYMAAKTIVENGNVTYVEAEEE